MSAMTSSQSSRLVLTLVMTGLALVALVLNALPLAPASAIRWTPSVPLILLFYWAVHRPEIFPRWLAFLMGLGQALLSGGPLGLWALVYTCVYEGAVSNRMFFVGRAAYSSLAGFALAAAAAAAIAWVIASLYFWRGMSPLPVAGHMRVTVLVYPFLAWFLSIIDRLLGGER